MSSRVVRAVVKRVGQKPEIVEINPGREELRGVVGGDIESVLAFTAPGTQFSIICYANKEGQFRELPLNFHRMIDHEPIAGDVVFVGDIAGNHVGIALETASQLVALITKHSPSTDQALPS
jgi:hypothetical protein